MAISLRFGFCNRCLKYWNLQTGITRPKVDLVKAGYLFLNHCVFQLGGPLCTCKKTLLDDPKCVASCVQSQTMSSVRFMSAFIIVFTGKPTCQKSSKLFKNLTKKSEKKLWLFVPSWYSKHRYLVNTLLCQPHFYLTHLSMCLCV